MIERLASIHRGGCFHSGFRRGFNWTCFWICSTIIDGLPGCPVQIASISDQQMRPERFMMKLNTELTVGAVWGRFCQQFVGETNRLNSSSDLFEFRGHLVRILKNPIHDVELMKSDPDRELFYPIQIEFSPLSYALTREQQQALAKELADWSRGFASDVYAFGEYTDEFL